MSDDFGTVVICMTYCFKAISRSTVKTCSNHIEFHQHCKLHTDSPHLTS